MEKVNDNGQTEKRESHRPRFAESVETLVVSFNRRIARACEWPQFGKLQKERGYLSRRGAGGGCPYPASGRGEDHVPEPAWSACNRGFTCAWSIPRVSFS